MNDLFTIISLVIAVSGATYTAIVAIRGYYQPQLKKAVETADSCSEAMGEAENKTLKERNQKRVNGLKCWHKRWSLSYAIPIILFSAISFGEAIHILVVYWTPGGEPQDFWYVYKWILSALVVIDAICIISTLVSYRVVMWQCSDIEENHRAAFEETGKALMKSEGE